MQHGYQCGMLWGATLAAGAQAHRLLGSGPGAQAAAVRTAQRLVVAFRSRNRSINCFEITETKMQTGWEILKFFITKGGPIKCFNMTARYAPTALGEIEAALGDEPGDAPPPPVSCAAMLARRLGLSELQATMAAGFAGGIGLSGGACGALGAAVWAINMASPPDRADKMGFKNPRALAAIDGFIQCTGYEFECSAIVGRRFSDVEDHAAHLRGGGCAEILDALAETAVAEG